jgi:hypothetical protein
LRIKRGRVGRVVFPPEQVAEVKAIACELPRTYQLPLSRFSRVELHRLVIERGVTAASASTIWRWLHEDAIKPWQTRSWIFSRDPEFADKAGRVLDLYARTFEGKRLRPDEYVISADEKTQLQALGRHHETIPPGPGRPGLIEFEYLRGGTLAYLAAWDVHHANLFDRIEQTTGIVPFGRLVDQVMQVEPYRSARTVYWVVDNGSSHAGKTSVTRMVEAYPNARLIHLPVHASWLKPDRDLLLDRSTQGPDAQRLRDSARTGQAPDGLRPALPHRRATIRVDLHPCQARRRDREDHPPPASAPRPRRMSRVTSGHVH